jgi:predicted TIM-barrel fold metal-dependent hydrolase
MLSASAIDPAFREVADWQIFDANVRLGHSGVYGELALETDALLEEMDRFGVRQALVSHFACDEYDAQEGNNVLASAVNERLVPVWAALPEEPFIQELSARRPLAVRVSYGFLKHNFSWAPWCAGQLYEYLQAHSILTVIAREDLAWDSLAQLLGTFPRLKVLLLETGYRADRYLFPLFKQHPDLYIDTSTYVAHRQLETFVDRFGPDHLLFGSRLPLYDAGAALAVLATARISDRAKLSIAGGTLRRLLGMGAQ